MPIPKSAPQGRRNSIASRYLESISCGGNDVSVLSMSSSNRSQQKLNDSISGATAPTVLMDQSASSWTTMETRSHGNVSRPENLNRSSRSEKINRSSQSPSCGDNLGRIGSAGVASCSNPDIKLGIESDCSSIESSSSQSSVESSSFHSKEPFRSPANASVRDVWKKHRIREREERRKRSSQPSPAYNNSSRLDKEEVFPKTPPIRQMNEDQPNHQDDSLSSPYAFARIPSENRSTAATEVMNNLTVTNRSRWQSSSDDDDFLSEAGAKTEIMTNRTDDVLSRPKKPRNSAVVWPPPSTHRFKWSPAPDKPQSERHMPSLVDDTSESTSAVSPTAPHAVSLLDATSSSMSTIDSNGQPSRLDQHIQGSDVSHVTTLQDSGSLNTESSSSQVETGKGQVATYGRRPVFDTVFEDREIEGSQQNSYRHNQPNPQIPRITSADDTTSTTDDEHLMPAKGASRSKGFVVYNHRKKSNMEEVFQKRPQSVASSSSTPGSSSDQEEMNEADQGESQAQSQRKARPSDYDHGKPPIQPVFSLDRLDLSVDVQSPIRKFRSESADLKVQPSTDVPTRSESISEPNEGWGDCAVENASDFICELDPICCPESKSSSTNDVHASSPVPDTRTKVTLEGDSVRSGDGMKRVIVKSSPTPKHNSNAVVKEPAYAIDKGNQRRKSFSRTPETVNMVSATEILKDLDGTKKDSTRSSFRPSYPSQRNPAKIFGSEGAIRPNAVREKIRTLNSGSAVSKGYKPPTGTIDWKQLSETATSGQKMVLGAHTSRESTGNEKPGYANAGYDEDDTDSVKSLRDKFEVKFSSNNGSKLRHQPEDDDDDGDDDNDTASVKSLREKLERRIVDCSPQNQLAPEPDGDDDDNDDDDTASIESLRERFEPQVEPKPSEVSKIRARFEGRKAPVIQNRGSNWHALRSTFEKTQPPRSINVTNNYNKSQKVATEASKADEIEQNLGFWSHPDDKLNSYKHGRKKEDIVEALEERNADKSGKEIPARTRGDKDEQYDRQLGVKTYSQWKKASSAAPASVRNRSFPKKIDIYGAKPTKQSDNRKETVDRELSNKITKPHETTFKQSKANFPKSRTTSPAVSPFSSMQGRVNNVSSLTSRKSLTSSAHRAVPPVKAKSNSPGMHQRLNRWVNQRHAEKRSPLATQGKVGEKTDEYETPGAESGRVAPVDPKTEDHETRKDINTHAVSNASFDELSKRTNRAVRDNETHGGQRSLEQAPPVVMRASNKAEIFRVRGGPHRGGSHQAAQGREHLHFVDHNQRLDEKNQGHQSKGSSTDTETTDGVTLDPSIAEVSCLTNPSTINSKGSKESKDGSTGMVQGTGQGQMEKISETSSSHASQAVPTSIQGKRSEPVLGNMGQDMKARTNTSYEKHASKFSPDVQSSEGKITKSYGEIHSKQLEETQWNVEQVDMSFPDRTPSSENLFDVDPVSNQHANIDGQGETISPEEYKAQSFLLKGVVSPTQPPEPTNVSHVSETSDLLSVPSQFDADYDAIMGARHQMLLSRQRSLQQRRTAREKERHRDGASTARGPVESRGSRMSDSISPHHPPPLPAQKDQARVHSTKQNSNESYRMRSINASTHGSFFGRTHPGTAKRDDRGRNDSAVQYRASKQAASYAAPLETASYSHDTEKSEYEHFRPISPADSSHSSRQSRSRSSSKINSILPKQSTSLFSRVTDRLGLSSAGDMTSKQKFMARLKSVRAKRLRRSRRRTNPNANTVSPPRHSHGHRDRGRNLEHFIGLSDSGGYLLEI